MENKNYIKIFLVALVSFAIGWMYFKKKDGSVPLSKLKIGKTKVFNEGGKYYIVFNGAVILSREITKEQYDTFLSAYPDGSATGNKINDYSTPSPKYTKEGGKFYEYVWTGSEYGKGIEITEDQYNFHLSESVLPSAVLASF